MSIDNVLEKYSNNEISYQDAFDMIFNEIKSNDKINFKYVKSDKKLKELIMMLLNQYAD